MIEFRQKIKELVTYILNPEERDEDVIENYTDTVMLACEEYHIKQLNVGQSEQLVCPDCKLPFTKEELQVKEHCFNCGWEFTDNIS